MPSSSEGDSRLARVRREVFGTSGWSRWRITYALSWGVYGALFAALAWGPIESLRVALGLTVMALAAVIVMTAALVESGANHESVC